MRYPIETRAIKLVYLSESSRLKKPKGMMMSMKAVIQKCRSTKNGTSSAFGLKPLTTPGIKSPMMIMYETPTPKHFIAIAASNMTAALGYVSCESAKKDELPLSRYRAQRACR